MKRALARQELEQISDWLSDGKTKEEILEAVDVVKRLKMPLEWHQLIRNCTAVKNFAVKGQ